MKGIYSQFTITSYMYVYILCNFLINWKFHLQTRKSDCIRLTILRKDGTMGLDSIASDSPRQKLAYRTVAMRYSFAYNFLRKMFKKLLFSQPIELVQLEVHFW